jgi:hypothetical protein
MSISVDPFINTERGVIVGQRHSKKDGIRADVCDWQETPSISQFNSINPSINQ